MTARCTTCSTRATIIIITIYIITVTIIIQVYNLFHPSNPVTTRLEPLLSAQFSRLAPVNVPRCLQ